MRSNAFLSLVRLASRFVLIAVCVLPFVSRPAQAQTFTVLYSFKGPPGDAAGPDSLILDDSGDLYGTTGGGGASYWGTAFKLSGDGKERVLYSFVGGYGQVPNSLVRDAKRTLSGATLGGGAYNGGTVFRLDEKGNENVLYSFRGGSDGWRVNGVIRDLRGNLYGTTVSGGRGSGCYYGSGCGTVFRVAARGKETILYTFAGGADGGNPEGELVQDSIGNLYGTTSIGGTFGCGTVFKLDPAGQKTILYSFVYPGGDGCAPFGALARDKAGTLYGTTAYGGSTNCASGCGTVFKVEASGKETVLYRFTNTGGDGANPYVGVALDAAGNIYGTTQNGGDNGVGVVFMLDTSGKETILHSFTGGTDGAFPNCGLVLDAAGNIYGGADLGGDPSCGGGQGCGTIFKLTR